MATNSQFSPVSLVVQSPTGYYYQQTSLKQCAAFISQLYEHITGDKKYYDYKLIRNRIDFEDGQFSGQLAGWKIIEFKTENEARFYIFNKQAIPSIKGNIEQENIRNIEIKNDRNIEIKNNRNIEIKNNRLIDVDTRVRHSSTVDERLAEFDILFEDILVKTI